MSRDYSEKTWFWYLHGDNDIGIVNYKGESPANSYTDDIAFEYTAYDFSAITDEESEVPLTHSQNQAVIAWMKMRYFEMMANIKLKDYYEKEFYKFLAKAKREKNNVPRKVIHRGPTALIAGNGRYKD
jgi:hypothetical protein